MPSHFLSREDNVAGIKMVKLGASDTEAEMGIQLCEYLKNKEVVLEVTNAT